MNFKTDLHLRTIIIAALCAAAAPADAGTYTYTSLAPAGSIQPAVGGINDSDQVVGSFQDPTTYVSHGFLWSNGSFTQIDVGSYGTFLTAINASGVAAGYYYASAADAKNFKYTPMTYDTVQHTHADIPFRGKYSKDSAAALGINDQGIVIGSAFVGPDSSAFFRNTRRTGFVNVPNAPYVTVGVAINNRNEALLSGVDLSYNEYSYVYRGGKFTLLAPPGGASVNGFGCASNSGFINPTGVVGGSYGVSTGVNGFTFSNGRYKSYSFPGQPAQTTVSGVSADGVVAGCYLDATAGYATKGFVYISKAYNTILMPGSSTTSIVAINAKSSLIGQYASASTAGVFIAQCPANQAPCTQ
jgi:probable HAF family extracellular repeat protein